MEAHSHNFPTHKPTYPTYSLLPWLSGVGRPRKLPGTRRHLPCKPTISEHGHGLVLAQPPVAVVLERLLHLSLGVHHEWPSPGHGLPDLLPRQQQEVHSLPCAVRRGTHHGPRGGQHGEVPRRDGGAPHGALAAVYVRQDGVHVGWDGVGRRRPRREHEIDVLHWDHRSDDSLHAVAFPGNDLDSDPGHRIHHRDFRGGNVLVLRGVHFVAPREIYPHLEDMQQAPRVVLTLVMDQPATCGHPLAISGTQHPAVAHGVVVGSFSGLDVRHGIKAPVRMPRSPMEFPRRVICGPQLIQHQVRVRLRRWECCDWAAHQKAVALPRFGSL
eukprot:RCo036424